MSEELIEENFVPRQFWGPREPGYPFRIQAPVPYVVVGFVRKNYVGPQAKVSPGPAPNQLACLKELCYVMSGDYRKNLPDIRFNFMLCGGAEPEIFEGRGWTRQPTLPVKYHHLNNQAYFIGIIGDFSEQDPAPNIFLKLDQLLDYAVRKEYLTKQHTRIDLANPFKEVRELKPTSNYISNIYY